MEYTQLYLFFLVNISSWMFHVFIILFLTIVWNPMFLKIIITLLGVARQHVRFIQFYPYRSTLTFNL